MIGQRWQRSRQKARKLPFRKGFQQKIAQYRAVTGLTRSTAFQKCTECVERWCGLLKARGVPSVEAMRISVDVLARFAEAPDPAKWMVRNVERMARALATLSFLPDGITFYGRTWKSAA